ncbi:unnamed protein product [Arctogadus glacialis]
MGRRKSARPPMVPDSLGVRWHSLPCQSILLSSTGTHGLSVLTPDKSNQHLWPHNTSVGRLAAWRLMGVSGPQHAGLHAKHVHGKTKGKASAGPLCRTICGRWPPVVVMEGRLEEQAAAEGMNPFSDVFLWAAEGRGGGWGSGQAEQSSI